MLKVGTLLKHLSSIPAGTDTPLAAFSNYLSNFCRYEDFLVSDVVQSFLCTCLEHSQWQKRVQDLSEDLQGFLSTVASRYNETWNAEEIKWPTQLQIIEIQHADDWIEAVNSHLTFCYKKGEKFRLFHDRVNNKVVAVVLFPQGEVAVRAFARKFYLFNGTLEPLRSDLQVRFDRRLELVPEFYHQLEMGANTLAHFLVEDGQLFGRVIRGALFQKAFEFKGEPLAKHARLFLALKRVEQFFVSRESDSFYQGLVQNLERAIELVRTGDPEATEESWDALAQAQTAAECVFTDDKILTLLIRDLQHQLANKAPSAPRPVSAKEKTWITPTLPPEYDLTN